MRIASAFIQNICVIFWTLIYIHGIVYLYDVLINYCFNLILIFLKSSVNFGYVIFQISNKTYLKGVLIWKISKKLKRSEKRQAYLMRMQSGDHAMIKQSIRIFVQNAAKYSDKGNNIKLTVVNMNGRVSYLVQDEGIGIADEELSHIFERFYRSDKARNSSTGGSGLGLSIAKWIIDAHKGNVQVLSRQDIGTRIIVSFDLFE